MGTKSGIANILVDSLDRAIALGYSAKVDCHSCAVIGGVHENAVRVGIGVDSPRVLEIKEPGASNPIGITQTNLGGGASMELMTTDGGGELATRVRIGGGFNFTQSQFYFGPKGEETVRLNIRGRSDSTTQVDLITPSNSKPVFHRYFYSNNLQGGAIGLDTKDQLIKLIYGGNFANSVKGISINSSGYVAINHEVPEEVLDVKGTTKISGNLDIANHEDSTSIVIGKDAGIASDFSVPRSNTFLGVSAGMNHDSGAQNTAIGKGAMKSFQSGLNNTALGYQAMLDVNSGNENTAIGADALKSNVGGNGNTAIGFRAIAAQDTGDYQTAVGFFANVTGGCTNTTSIGNNSFCSGDNTIRLGNSAITSI